MKLNLKISGGIGAFMPQVYSCEANEELKNKINDAILNKVFENKTIPQGCDSREVELVINQNGIVSTFNIDESCVVPEALDLIDDIICVTEG